MKLKWYGHAAFRITSDAGFSIITDPYTPEISGYEPITESADLVITSSDDDESHCRADLIPGMPTAVNALRVAEHGGEQMVNGITIQAMETREMEEHPYHAPGQNAMYRFEVDGIRIAHMGDVGNPLTERQIEFYEDVDLLLALTGDVPTIGLDDLKIMIDRMQPKLIVPMHFRTLTYKPRDTKWIASFLSYFDDADVDFAFGYEVDLQPQDIPQQTRVLVMDYVR